METNKRKIKVLSLFDGMSCGQIALDELGIEVEAYYASEIKPHGIYVSTKNYPNTIHIGDVTKVSYDKATGVLTTENGTFDVGEIDLVMGGSPCQNFSVACIKEKRKGLEGEKSALFYEFLRILGEVEPKWFLLENVASMDAESKSQLDTYMGVTGVKIDSALFVAALRKRIYWTNLHINLNITDAGALMEDVIDDGYVPYKKSSCLIESHSRPVTDKLRLTRRHLGTRLMPVVYKSEKHFEEVTKHYNANYKGLSAKEVDAIRDGIDNSVYEGVRILSQNEMERLQGVPVGYCDGISRNNAASLLGDGWTVPVIKHILKGIIDEL